MNDYNTQRPTLILKEYGRNIQKLVEFVKKTDDAEKRNEFAATLVDLMKQINPSVKETIETNQKLWDDLYIMADFDLEIQGPFPKPEKDILYKKPKRLGYSANGIKFKHYGRNIELLIKKAMELEDPKERDEAAMYIGRLMKGFFTTWNRENADEATIVENIKQLSSGVIELDVDYIRENRVFDSNVKERDITRERDNRDRNDRGDRDRNRNNKNNRNRNNQNRRRRN